MTSTFRIANTDVPAGTHKQIDIPVSRLPGGTWLSLPLAVLHGQKPGKTVWLSGAIHGDEVNGIEIIREVLTHLDPKKMSGTVIAVPMVNVFGVLQGSRYLPDRRDLNRSFPGSKRGSLASRLAHLFITEVVKKCDLGIDFHTATSGRNNFPQVRVNGDHPNARRMAKVFGAPVTIYADDRSGSLRYAASRLGVPNLLFEGGEALKFSNDVVKVGVAGTLRVLDHVKVIKRPSKGVHPTVVCHASSWARAKAGGVCQLRTKLGAKVKKDETVAVVTDAFGGHPNAVKAPRAGIVIGISQRPMVNSGDALVHVAAIGKSGLGGEKMSHIDLPKIQP